MIEIIGASSGIQYCEACYRSRKYKIHRERIAIKENIQPGKLMWRVSDLDKSIFTQC